MISAVTLPQRRCCLPADSRGSEEHKLSWAWRRRPVIPALSRWSQEGQPFKFILSYMRFCLREEKKVKKEGGKEKGEKKERTGRRPKQELASVLM